MRASPRLRSVHSSGSGGGEEKGKGHSTAPGTQHQSQKATAKNSYAFISNCLDLSAAFQVGLCINCSVFLDSINTYVQTTQPQQLKTLSRCVYRWFPLRKRASDVLPVQAFTGNSKHSTYWQDVILSHQLGELGQSQCVIQQNGLGRNNLNSDCRVMFMLLVRDKQSAPSTPKYHLVISLHHLPGQKDQRFGRWNSFVRVTNWNISAQTWGGRLFLQLLKTILDCNVSEVDYSRPNLVLLCNILLHCTNCA